MAAINKFRKMFDKTTEKKGDQWLEKVPAWLGRKDQTIATETYGLVYVRTADGQVLKVFNNNKVDLKFNLLVRIGRHKDEPNVWQIVGRREAWDVPAASGVAYHHEQHEFMGPDMVMLDRRQISQLSVIVSDGAAFIVQIYGAFVHTANGIVEISSQQMDLSAYVVSVGAEFINIESDDAGTLSVHTGTNFGSPLVAAVTDIPVPDPGKYVIATMLFHEGQTELLNDDIRVPMPLGVIPKSSGFQIHEAAAGTPASGDEFPFYSISGGVLKKITFGDLKAIIPHQYRQFVTVSDGAGGFIFVSSGGAPVFVLQDLE